LVLFSVYLVGILLSVVIAIIFKKTIFKLDESPFVMELPPYRMPTLRSTLKHMWNKSAQYLQKMGGIILVASIVIWYLGYYPTNVNYSKNYEKLKIETQVKFDKKISQIADLQQITDLKLEKSVMLENLDAEKKSEHQQKTYIGRMGQFIEPAIAPLGFDWKMGVSIITGIAAKEIVVSSMNVLYYDKSVDVQKYKELQNYDDTQKLSDRLHNYTNEKGEKPLNWRNAYAFMLFILLYFPCMASMAAIRKETGTWKWAFFTMAYTTVLAWVVAFGFYQITGLF